MNYSYVRGFSLVTALYVERYGQESSLEKMIPYEERNKVEGKITIRGKGHFVLMPKVNPKR